MASPLRLIALISVLAITGCGTVRFLLPGHESPRQTAPLTLTPGQRLGALSTPARLPAPGGFALALASEDAEIVAVTVTDGPAGATDNSIEARHPGSTTLHYVNRFTLPRDLTAPPEQLRATSLGSFIVTVTATRAALSPGRSMNGQTLRSSPPPASASVASSHPNNSATPHPANATCAGL